MKNKVYLVFFAHGQNAAHIELIESGQHGTGILGVLKSLRDAKTHTIHFYTTLTTGGTGAKNNGLRGWEIGGFLLGNWGFWNGGGLRDKGFQSYDLSRIFYLLGKKVITVG